MNWSMKEVLFILSSFFLLSCSSINEEDENALMSQENDQISAVDGYLLVLSNILENGLFRNESLNADTLLKVDDLIILGTSNLAEPGQIIFSGSDQQLNGIISDLNNLPNTQYFSDANFDVWLILLNGKRVLEFTKYLNPALGDVIVVRQKIQE
jgi:hypothetical protein